tara:strand:- start:3710 stop:4642 length:933 start_codon:yes stop_codon:yes gene_type:complete
LNQIKKRHHYVWRNYLRAWSNSNDLIPSLIKINNKIAITNLTNVAQKKLFYSLEEFTFEEEYYLKKIILSLSNKETETIFLEYFNLFTSYSRFKRILDKNNISENKKSEIEQFLKFMKSNFMEDFHSDFEKFGQKLIDIKKVEDLEFLKDSSALMKTYLFLCFQYVRTNKMKNAFIKNFEGRSTVKAKFFNIISFVIATGMANGLMNYKESKFVFIRNNSKIDFITSDQPIINLKEHETNNKGNVKSMELFYPISPKIALKVHYNDGKNFEHIKIYENEVKKFNQIIFDKSEDFVFASSSEQLEIYKNCL